MRYALESDGPMLLSRSCVVLTTVALLAAYVAARRAGRVDPIAALRED